MQQSEYPHSPPPPPPTTATTAAATAPAVSAAAAAAATAAPAAAAAAAAAAADSGGSSSKRRQRQQLQRQQQQQQQQQPPPPQPKTTTTITTTAKGDDDDVWQIWPHSQLQVSSNQIATVKYTPRSYDKCSPPARMPWGREFGGADVFGLLLGFDSSHTHPMPETSCRVFCDLRGDQETYTSGR